MQITDAKFFLLQSQKDMNYDYGKDETAFQMIKDLILQHIGVTISKLTCVQKIY